MKVSHSAQSSSARNLTPRRCLQAILKTRAIGVRCYDNCGVDAENGTVDRYTAVFTRKYRHLTGEEQWYVGMNDASYHPLGFGQHGSSRNPIDLPSYKHHGKRISVDRKPLACQRLLLDDCMDLSVDLAHD